VSKYQLEDLWVKSCDGDQSAYNELHKTLFPGLYRYVYSLSKDAELTRDLLQDLFLKLWMKRPGIGGINNVQSFFYNASRMIYIDHYRKERRREGRMSFFIQDEEENSAETIVVNVECEQQFKNRIHQAFEKLPPRQRQIIYLRYLEGMAYDQIANKMGIKYQSVVNHVFRGVNLIRNQFSSADYVTVAVKIMYPEIQFDLAS
jgi:RNA polymerase sigma-70 factor (ECF subfamily)